MEAGAASSILTIAEYGDVPLAETQKDLTPLQRMVILKEAERQHDEAQNNQGTTTPGSGMKNSVPGAGAALGQNETVTYTNEGA